MWHIIPQLIVAKQYSSFIHAKSMLILVDLDQLMSSAELGLTEKLAA